LVVFSTQIGYVTYKLKKKSKQKIHIFCSELKKCIYQNNYNRKYP